MTVNQSRLNSRGAVVPICGASIRVLAPSSVIENPRLRVAAPRGGLFSPIAVAFYMLATLAMAVGCGRAPDSGAPGTASPTGTASAASPSDPTANWMAYHSIKGQFSLRHPASWFVSMEGDSGGLVSVGMGAKHPMGPLDYATDISAGSWSVDKNLDTSCFQLRNPTTTQSVTIQGVTGSRKTGTLTACQGGQSLDLTEYDFTTNGRNYVLTYTARPDAVPLSDFDLMVKNTFSFSS